MGTDDLFKKRREERKRRMADFEKGEYKPSEYNPGTMVHKLVEKLIGYIE